jgi:hypothetical protein
MTDLPKDLCNLADFLRRHSWVNHPETCEQAADELRRLTLQCDMLTSCVAEQKKVIIAQQAERDRLKAKLSAIKAELYTDRNGWRKRLRVTLRNGVTI